MKMTAYLQKALLGVRNFFSRLSTSFICNEDDYENDNNDSDGMEEVTFNKFEDGVEIIMAKESGIKLSDIVVSSSASELEDLTEYLLNPENFDEDLFVPHSKILLIGESGLGKSALVQAFANTVGLMILRVSATRLLTTEGLIDKIFEIARSSSPYIIQIENFELFAAANGSNETSIGITTIYEILKTYLDIFDNVIVFACISNPEIDTFEIERTFKKVIELELPNLQERVTLLYEFGENSGFDDDVDLTSIARNCMGFTISNLKALIGNAICLARRDQRSTISSKDLLEAWDRMRLGSKSNTMYSGQSRKIAAYHEAGHALISYLLQGEDAVFRVVSIGRGSNGGATCGVPDEESIVRNEQDMLNDVCIFYGGRAAEKLIFGHYSSGASLDIRAATGIIVRMVQAYGMSEKIGPLNVEPKVALLSVITDGNKIQDLVSEECHRIATECDNKAFELLKTNIDRLHQLAKYLIDNESITGEEMDKLLNSVEN